MQISYAYSRQTGGRSVNTAIILGDDANGERITGYRPEFMLEIQKSAPPRATWKKGFARGLAEMDVSWNVSRSFGDHAQNMAFIHNHIPELLLNPAGSLGMVVEGTTAAIWFWRTALVEKARIVDVIGAWSLINYQFWCTDLTTSTT